MAEIEEGSIETALHIDIDQKDFDNVIKQLSGLSKNSTIKRGFEDLGDVMQDSIKASVVGFSSLEAALDKIADGIKVLNENMSKLPQSLALTTLKKSAAETSKEFEDLKKKTAELEQKIQEKNKVENDSAKTENLLIKRQKELKTELQNLIYKNQENTAEYKTLEAELADVTDKIGDMRERIKVLSNDENFTAGLVQGLSGVAAGFQVAQGALGLFADENEELNKILVKVQSMMGVVNGLMTIQQTLNSDSAFSQTILNKAKEWWVQVQEKANAATVKNTAATVANNSAQQASTAATVKNATATATETAAQTANTTAKTAGAVANLGLAGSFRLLGAAISSVPVFGWIAAGITALIAVVSKLRSNAEKAKKTIRDFNDVRMESYEVAVKESIEIDRYTKKIEDFNGTQKQETALVDELNSKYGEQLGNYKTLAEWKDILKQKGEDYIEVIKLEAQAQAYLAKVTELTTKKLQLQNTDANDLTKGKIDLFNVNQDDIEEAYDDIDKYARKVSTGIVRVLSLGLSSLWDESFDEIDKHNETIANKLSENIDKQLKMYSDEYEKLVSSLDELKKKSGIGKGNAVGSGDDADYTYLEKLRMKRDEEQKKLERIAPSNVAAINAQKSIVHSLVQQIKNYQDLITYETYYQRLQRKRNDAMAKLEGLDTTKASQEEIDKQKEIVRQLDLQIKAHQKKIAITTYYEGILANISDIEEKLKQLSFEDANDKTKVDALKDELKHYQELKQKFEDMISTSSYYEQLTQQINRDKERLNKLTEDELKDTKLIAELRQRIWENEERRRKFEEQTTTDFSGKISRYQSYANELVKIEAEYQKKIQAIENNSYLSESEKEAQTRAVNSDAKLRFETTAAENEINDNQLAIELKDIVDIALGMSMQEIEDRMPVLISQIKQTEKKGGDNSGVLAKLNAELEALKTKYQELSETEQKSFEKMGRDKNLKVFQTYFTGISDIIRNTVNELDGLSDEAKETANTILSFADSGLTMITNIDTLVHSTTKGMEVTAETAVTSISTVEKASVILAIISAAIQVAMKIAQLFANRKTKKANKEIEVLQSQVDALKGKYDDLDESISKAYGNSAVKMIKEQDVLLRQQKQLIKQQIEAEKTKKSKKQDSKQIKEWQDQIKEIDKTLAGRKETIVEQLIGKDYKGVLEDFSKEVMAAMDNAETSVEDAVANIAKSIKKASVQQHLNDKLQPLTTKYADQMANAMADGFLDEYEKKNLANIERTIADTSQQYLSQFDDLWEKAAEERNAVSGGITNMSQDSADEMNGRLTQMQSHTFSINENVKQITEFASRQLVIIQGIHSDTSTLVTTTKAIKGTLDDITIKGVKLKQ